MKIAELMKQEFDCTNVALYVPRGAVLMERPYSYGISTRRSPKLIMTGAELIQGIAAAQQQIAQLQEAIDNAQRILDNRS